MVEGQIRPTGECVHHWIIETASKKLSQGECRDCGITKQFNNYSDFAGGYNTEQMRSDISVMTAGNRNRDLKIGEGSIKGE